MILNTRHRPVIRNTSSISDKTASTSRQWKKYSKPKKIVTAWEMMGIMKAFEHEHVTDLDLVQIQFGFVLK